MIKVLKKKQIVNETFIMQPPLSCMSIPRRVLLLSPLSSGHQELDNYLVWLCFKSMIKEIVESEIGDNWLWTSNATPAACLFQNKVMFMLKDYAFLCKPLLSSQTPFGSLLLVPWGCPLNRGSTVISLAS